MAGARVAQRISVASNVIVSAAASQPQYSIALHGGVCVSNVAYGVAAARRRRAISVT